MPDNVRLSFLQWLANEDQDRQDRYTAYREYYDGDHATQLTSRQRKYLQIKVGQDFNDNYCAIVVDALAERLRVTGFDAGDNEGLAELLWEWWIQNRMDGVQKVTHTAAIRDGDGYLIVEWLNDEGRPRLVHEPAYDGIEGVKVHYSKEKRGEIAFASKRWRVEAEDASNAGKARRLNLYYPDRIEKFISHDDAFEGGWQEYIEEGEGTWPIPWTNTDTGKPLGVPVVHFKNADQGYNYGQSELKSIISLQNALNKALIDLLAAADTTAFRIFWALGDDPSGLEIAPGSWVYSLKPPGGEEGAAFGYFPGEDLSPLIDLKDALVAEIARVSRTPMSYFQTTGQVAAEGTLKQQESGLVARAEDRQVGFGNSWEDAFIMARRLFNTFGGGGLDEEQPISTLWADAQTRNEKEHLETLKLKSDLGVPAETLWQEMGYDADEVADMRAQRGEELQQQSNIGGALLQAFERGGGPGGQVQTEEERGQ